MPNIIKPKRSNSAGVVPTTSNLASGEIGVNMADQKVYINNGTSVVQVGAGNLTGLGDTNISSPTNGQSLQYNSATGKWVNASGSGTGDVVGPASATDNALARFDGTTGKLIQNGLITQDDNGNLAGILSETYNTITTPPTIVEGLEAWDSGNGTLELGLKGGIVSYKYGQQEYLRAYNGSGSSMTVGQVVYIVGAQGNRVDVRLAKADSDTTSASTIGFVAEPIANGGEGFVLVSGNLPKLNTSTLTAGATLYLSPTTAGAYTTTAPTAPNHRVVLGWVERVSATVGSFYVKVDNGYELDELHNVLITSPASGNTLIYDAVAGVWKNANITGGTGLSVTNGAGTISLANTGVTSAVAGTGISVSSATGAVTITNTAPDQTVSLTGSGATTISGTYPNFTISSVNTTYSPATSTVAGLIELNSDTVQTTAANAVTSTASRTYGLQVNAAGQGVINVPWTDTVYTLPAATSTVLGGIKLGSDTVQTVAANAVTATASRTYALQVNSSGQAVVNVPWTDTNSGGTVTSVGGTGTVAGISLSGTVTTSGNLTLGGTFALPTGQVTTRMIYDTFTATASQTTFTPSATYTSGKIEVFVNGVKMRNGSDVTVTSGTSVVMAFALTAGDLVDLVYPT